MLKRTWIGLFAAVTLLAGPGCCCWHPWGGHCCRYYEPPAPKVILEPAPQGAPQPIRQYP